MSEFDVQKIRAEVRASLSRRSGSSPIDTLSCAIELAKRHGEELNLDQYRDIVRVEALALGVPFV